jgi:hypothetical protein
MLALPGSFGGMLLSCLIATAATEPGSTTPRQIQSTAAEIRIDEAYGRLPLMFEPNAGQHDPRVRFLSRGRGCRLFLSAAGAEMTLYAPPAPHGDEPLPVVLRVELVGADPRARVSGEVELPGKVNYFTGNDPTRWRANIPTFARVMCEQVYPGVDLVYYGNQQRLEYDFILAPGVDPKIVELKFHGADEIRVDNNGDLVLQTAGGNVRQLRPVIYQEVDGPRREIPGGYTVRADDRIGFQLGRYDASKPLVIDPVLAYSTYYQARTVKAIAVDTSGNAYITGMTPGNPNNVLVAKLNASGSALVYSTSLGGGNENDEGFDIAIDSAGDAYVSGYTNSATFPTVNAFQVDRNGGQDFFVARLNGTGALVYSTYLGGSGPSELGGCDIAVDSSGNAFVAGMTASSGFPTTSNAFQSVHPGFIASFLTRLNTNASGAASLVYSTYLPASIYDLALDTSGHVYLVGDGASFPTTGKAIQRVAKTDATGFVHDVVVATLDTNPATCTPEPGTNINCRESLLYSTYLGGTDGLPTVGLHDYGYGIAVDSSG